MVVKSSRNSFFRQLPLRQLYFLKANSYGKNLIETLNLLETLVITTLTVVAGTNVVELELILNCFSDGTGTE